MEIPVLAKTMELDNLYHIYLFYFKKDDFLMKRMIFYKKGDFFLTQTKKIVDNKPGNSDIAKRNTH